MKDFSHGPYISITCPNCGWGWAAYDSAVANNDSGNYSVTFKGGQYTKERALYLTRTITGNSLLSKRLLDEGGTIIIDSFKAKETELKNLGVQFTSFPK